MGGAAEDEPFADVTAAEVGVVLALELSATVVDVVDEVGQLVVVVDVGEVVDDVDAEVVAELDKEFVDMDVDVDVVHVEDVEVRWS